MDISLSSSEKKMASISMMIGGAILNAAAFTSGNYCFLNTGKASLEEKTLHDKALEAYRAAMAKTPVTAPNFLTGSRPTEKSNLHEHRLRVQTR